MRDMASVADIDDVDQEGEGGPSPQGRNAVAGNGAAPGAEAAKPARAPRKKDPKLDLDLLEADGGFNDIWHKMAPAFKASFQGEGHEVSDLRRLLELYQRWQVRFYPHGDFDTFVTKLEKAGRSRMVKAKMGSMRQNLLGLIFPTEEEPQPGPEPAPEGPAAGAAPGGGRVAQQAVPAVAAAAARGTEGGAAAAAVADLDEDDELVALQKEAEWEAAYDAMDELEGATAPPPTATTATATAARQQQQPNPRSVDMDMDELMDLVEELHYAVPPPAAATPAVAARGRQDGTTQAPVAAAAGSGGPGGRTGPTGGEAVAAGAAVAEAYVDPDEELMALAMRYDTSQADVAVAPGPPVPRPPAAQGSGDAGQVSGGAAAAAATDAAATQEGQRPMYDEDEELRMLAAMDTSEAEAAVAATATAPWQVPDDAGRRPPPLSLDPDGAAMDIDGSYEPSVRQYGDMGEVDEELMALAAANTQTLPSAGGGDAAAETYGGSRDTGGGAYGSSAAQGEELRVESAHTGSAFGGSAVDGGGFMMQPESEVPDSQGVIAGMLLRGILMSQSQTQEYDGT